MKLITLNTWGARIYQPQIEFLELLTNHADVFCFQEVYNGAERLKPQSGVVTDMYQGYQKILRDYESFHSESGIFDVEGTGVSYGVATFYKKTLQIIEKGTYEIFKLNEDIELPKGVLLWNRLLQYVTVPYHNTTITIFNLHGLYTGGDKNDGSARILQSQRVKDFMSRHSGEKILCGDFNLNPETKSFAILAEGMQDLIKESGITCTRSHYYPKERKFADYILASPGVQVSNFQVLQDIVSDHLPLVLEF